MLHVREGCSVCSHWPYPRKINGAANPPGGRDPRNSHHVARAIYYLPRERQPKRRILRSNVKLPRELSLETLVKIFVQELLNIHPRRLDRHSFFLSLSARFKDRLRFKGHCDYMFNKIGKKISFLNRVLSRVILYLRTLDVLYISQSWHLILSIVRSCANNKYGWDTTLYATKKHRIGQ